MEHRILYRLFSPHHHLLRRTLLIAAILLVALESAAMAQSAPPPPPPADMPATPGQSYVRAVRISDVAGQVQVWQNGQIAFNQAEPNMPAVEGMRFVTGRDGRLEIEFEDGSVARLAPNSSLRLTELRRDPAGNTVTRIDALSGLSYYELNGRAGQFSVGLDQETATTDGGSIFRIDLDNDPSELAVMQGEVHVSDGDGVSVDVHPNQTFQTDPDSAGEFTVADSVTANSWDQWNSDRDQALADMQASQTTARAATNSPDDSSWNDLDYYGSWYNVPGYGQVWSPNGVGANWDPFGNGYWGYYPSFGYTWISAYPWGWWPYHCGGWNYLNSWGWVWAPGGCGWGWTGSYGAGWVPYPTVGHHPPAYRPPMRPGHPGPGQPVRRLISVDRGSQYAEPFRFHHIRSMQPRPMNLNGATIEPLRSAVHPIRRGPLGETFTSSLVRQHPGLAPTATRPLNMPNVRVPSPQMPVNRQEIFPGYRPSRPGIEPPRPSAPPRAAPVARPAPAPRVSAPAARPQ